jgi:hypothetical protein
MNLSNVVAGGGLGGSMAQPKFFLLPISTTATTRSRGVGEPSRGIAEGPLLQDARRCRRGSVLDLDPVRRAPRSIGPVAAL